MPAPTATILTGKTESHLCSSTDAARLGASVHHEVAEPFLRLRGEAAAAGFDLRILSGFRGFSHQAAIWNRKATGELAVRDSHGTPLDVARLSSRELVYSILRWSALPGGSRHHWGTDVDVYDESARPSDYEIDLLPEEVEAGGMFAPLHEWLDEQIAAGTSHGFFRPYAADRHGVAPERWHLSHAPVATRCADALTIDILRAALAESSIELRKSVLESLDDIYERFVTNTTAAPTTNTTSA